MSDNEPIYYHERATLSHPVYTMARKWPRYAIWKYVLGPDATTLEVPEPASLLKVAAQGDDVCLWFKVAPGTSRTVRLKYAAIMTGEEFTCDDDEKMRHLDTVQAGDVVVHVFRVHD